MSLTLILNKAFIPHDIFMAYCPNLLGLKKYENRILIFDSITIGFDGIIFNYNELLNLVSSYCEYQDNISDDKYHLLIIYLYKKYGIDQTLNMLDGVFSLIIFDTNNYLDNYNLYIVTDFFGEKSLNLCEINNVPIAFTNSVDELLNLDCIKMAIEKDNNTHNIVSIENGTYYHFRLSNKVLSNWKFYDKKKYMNFPMSITNITPYYTTVEYSAILNKLFILSIQKRIDSIKGTVAIYAKEISYLFRTMTYSIPNLSNMNNLLFYILQPLHLVKSCNIDKYDSDIESFVSNEIQIQKQYIYIEDDNEISPIMAMDQIIEESIIMDYGADYIFGDAYNNIDDPIEFDKQTRNCFIHLKNAELETIKKNKPVYSPFFDKNLLQFYFSIPLQIRFNLRKNNQILTSNL